MTEANLDVLFTPADFAALEARDLTDTVCVVFDVLRATSSMVTALANGAAAVIPVGEISEALALRKDQPDVLLAGERQGLKIASKLSGGVPFDFGNSPLEFSPEKVRHRTIVMTTTNGTRALRACSRAWTTFVASFLNLGATAALLQSQAPRQLLVVCSGTFEQAAYEDVLAAGALCDLLGPAYVNISDAAEIARRLYQLERSDLTAAMGRSRNARRLLANTDLAADVPFCLQLDHFDLVAELGTDGAVHSQQTS
jgi:2-phosphosulfolactate phosphatase